MDQPLTARQLSRKTGLSFDICRDVIPQLAAHGLVRCLNDSARRGRLYWLTKLGKSVQQKLSHGLGRAPPQHHVPAIDWHLYGRVCFSHRSAIIKALVEPMQPATIKRKAYARDPFLRMSANNTRDVMRLFVACGIARPVRFHKKSHLRYELTDVGLQIQELLRRVEVFA